MMTLTVKAHISNLSMVQDALGEWLDSIGCPMKTSLQLQMAVEELFVNVASYAYGEEEGDLTLSYEYEEELSLVRITFRDQGMPFNPAECLEQEEESTRLHVEDRGVGGLGILMVYKTADQVHYSYRDGWNILILEKKL